MKPKQPYPVVIFLFFLTCLILQIYLPDDTKQQLLVSPQDLIFHPTIEHIGSALLAGFLHTGWGHFLGNFTVIAWLGYYLEKRLGSMVVLKLLAASGFGSLVLHCLSNINSSQGFLGASGYGFGVLTAYALLI